MAWEVEERTKKIFALLEEIETLNTLRENVRNFKGSILDYGSIFGSNPTLITCIIIIINYIKMGLCASNSAMKNNPMSEEQVAAEVRFFIFLFYSFLNKIGAQILCQLFTFDRLRLDRLRLLRFGSFPLFLTTFVPPSFFFFLPLIFFFLLQGGCQGRSRGRGNSSKSKFSNLIIAFFCLL